VQKQRAEKSCGPRQRRRGLTCVVPATLTNARSGKTDRYFICRGGPAVPRAAACGARRQCCGAREGAPSLEKRYPLTSLLLIPQRQTAGTGNVRRFPESEVISAQPATRQATDPICHLHNPAIRTQTPGPGRASHMTRRKCCRAKCIQCLSSGLSTNGTARRRSPCVPPGWRSRSRASTRGQSSPAPSGSDHGAPASHPFRPAPSRTPPSTARGARLDAPSTSNRH
jgi:hypothetical protein